MSTAATGAQEKTTLYGKSANKIAYTHSHTHVDDVICLWGMHNAINDTHTYTQTIFLEVTNALNDIL